MPANKDKRLTSQFLKDQRGELYVNKIKGLEFNVIFTKTGVYRAGDYHLAKQYSIILHGEIELTLRQKNKDIVKRYGSNELVVIPPNIHHLYKFLADTVMLEWLAGPYQPRYYQPYRKIIEQQFKQSKH